MDKKIIDVGGARNTYPHATHIIDIMPKPEDCKLHYTQMDICSGRWNYLDKEFDYVFTKDTLEDIKDPFFVCKEISRVGKAGRIVVPSILTECRIGIDPYPNSFKYAGYCHHKWLCFTSKGDTIIFMPKTPLTLIVDWTKGLPCKNSPEYIVFDWSDKVNAMEIIPIDWEYFYLCLSRYFVYDPLNIDKGESLNMEFKNVYEEKKWIGGYGIS